MNSLALIWKTSILRRNILIILGLLILTRIIAHIPLPNVDLVALKSVFQGNQFLNLLDVFSGGGLTNFSIALAGVGPYITASIVVQLLTMIIPSWTELQKEGGEQGRLKLSQYTRYLTLVLAPLQGYGLIQLLQSQGGGQIFGSMTLFTWFVVLLSVTAGSMLIMWIGELISEMGLGNGVSLIIFAGIVSRLPAGVQSLIALYDPSRLPVIIGFIAVALLVVVGIVYVTEAQRNIPVTYARQQRGYGSGLGQSSNLPLRLNQAGVVPIIFAISMLLFPAMVAQFFLSAKTAWVALGAQKVIEFTNSQNWYYSIAYFALVVIFTYFYTSVVFQPEDAAKNIQRSGGFIPGLRPGTQTADYLMKVLNRITLPGSLFLGFIAILPFLLQKATGTQALTLGGTSLLIVVATAIETIKQVQSQLTMRNYDA